MAKTTSTALELATQVKMVDLRFTDLFGQWQHFSLPAHLLDEELFDDARPRGILHLCPLRPT